MIQVQHGFVHTVVCVFTNDQIAMHGFEENIMKLAIAA